MTLEHSPQEYDLFFAFINDQFAGTLSDTSLEEALVTFRAYQKQLLKLKLHLQPSVEQADRQEVYALDLDAVLARVEARVARNKPH